MVYINNAHEYEDLRRKLRQTASQFERSLWTRLRGKQLGGFKFRRQHGIGNYVVDFYCVSAKLVVEIDGFSHTSEEPARQDITRQSYLESVGNTVLRFSNDQVKSGIETVLEQIHVVASRLSSRVSDSE